MKLSHLTNKILLSDTMRLATEERKLTSSLLYHLHEIDRRKLFSDLKYPSLFAYCVHELGYSESSAQRRIVAARMLTTMPDLGRKIETGRLTVTNIAQVVGATKDKTERLSLLGQVEGLTKKQCEKKIFEVTGREIPAKDSKKRISPDKIQVGIVLKEETVDKLDHLKGLLGKESLDEVLEYAITAAIEKIEKKKFHVTTRPKSPPPVEVDKLTARRSPVASVKREVYLKGKRCSNCGGTQRLQFDHREAFALGGNSNLSNMRLLCHHCNQRARIRSGLSYGALRRDSS